MNPFVLILSSSGRLSRQPFAIAAVVVYVAAVASQTLLTPAVMARAGVLAFAVAQAALIWVWFALHAKRLHDAEHGTAAAAGLAVIWALAVVLFVLIMAVLYQSAAAAEGNTGSSLVAVLAFLYLVAILQGTTDFGPLGLVLAAFIVAAFSPFLIAIGFSIWAGSRPSKPAEAKAPPA
jgi:uncharacterized membrane protein YhaH (DUF805 family)